MSNIHLCVWGFIRGNWKFGILQPLLILRLPTWHGGGWKFPACWHFHKWITTHTNEYYARILYSRNAMFKRSFKVVKNVSMHIRLCYKACSVPCSWKGNCLIPTLTQLNHAVNPNLPIIDYICHIICLGMIAWSEDSEEVHTVGPYFVSHQACSSDMSQIRCWINQGTLSTTRWRWITSVCWINKAFGWMNVG